MADTSKYRCPTCGRTHRNGERAYGEFHRTNSAMRWVTIVEAKRLAQINLDCVLWLECHDKSYEPIALIETAQDIGQKRKSGTATRNLAKRTDPVVPAYLVLYTLADDIDECTGEPRIVSLRIKQLWPNETDFFLATPRQYFRWLVNLREREQEKLLRYLGQRDEARHKRNHDLKRLQRKQDDVSDQFDLPT